MITVKEVVALYLKSLSARVAADDYSAHGFANDSRDLALFAARFGSQTIDQCKQHDLSSWLEENPQWKSVDTKRRIVSSITACFNWAFFEELVSRSPYRRPRTLRGKTGKVRRPATHEEYVTLMRKADRPLRRALYMLRKTGMRTCEVRDLTWDEVYLDGPSPHLSIVRHKTFRQTGKPRKIGLDPSTARFLRNLKRQYARHCNCDCPTCQASLCPNVFTNHRGTAWSRHSLGRHLRRTAARIGLDEGVADRVTAYCLRHFFTVNAIEAGVPTRSIADQLGHAKTTTIDTVYGSHTRLRVEHLSNVAEEINRKRNRRPGPDGHDNNQPKGEDK
jgi:integrase